jgi:hypothetical protein
VYRRLRCAAEEFVDAAGPCGKGEHYGAVYQWGLEGDPNKDAGSIRTQWRSNSKSSGLSQSCLLDQNGAYRGMLEVRCGCLPNRRVFFRVDT